MTARKPKPPADRAVAAAAKYEAATAETTRRDNELRGIEDKCGYLDLSGLSDGEHGWGEEARRFLDRSIETIKRKRATSGHGPLQKKFESGRARRQKLALALAATPATTLAGAVAKANVIAGITARMRRNGRRPGKPARLWAIQDDVVIYDLARSLVADLKRLKKAGIAA